MAMKLTSSAFAEGDRIPNRHTCEGGDVSPPLNWTGAPAETKSFVIIADDPDAPAGTWVHWVIYNMPVDLSGVGESVSDRERLPNGALQGMNDFKRIGYGGPCPPPGKPHRYYFTLYALDRVLDVKPGATKSHLLSACRGHVLAEAKLMGRFGR